ncbi:MAG TPA: WXG100 family type VII secretion target [Chloroflexia bacterium]|jgi:WXG100 family type VII secretion target
MTANIIQINYDDMDSIAARFGQQAEMAAALNSRVRQHVEALEQGGWEGKGASAFFAEIYGELLPAMQRLSHVLEEARTVTLQVKEVLFEAEQEAASFFGNGVGSLVGAETAALAGATTSGSASAMEKGDDGGSAVGDFFSGMWKEGKDSVTGLWTLATTDPRETAKGLFYGITHPAELWNAFKQPYVEALESGHPWEAVGRGVMFPVSALVGAKGLDKLAKTSRVGVAAQVVGRTTTPLRAAEDLAMVGRGSFREATLQRYLAQQSTHAVRAADGKVPDLVGLGSSRAIPKRDFPGYVADIERNGGTYFNTRNDVWNILESHKTGQGWAVNREFLNSQMERGVKRIELRGESIQDVLDHRPTSYSRREIDYMRQYGPRYGYREVGDAWVRDWYRDLGYQVGGGVAGPTGSIIEDTRR